MSAAPTATPAIPTDATPHALNYQTPSAYAASGVWAKGQRVQANDCTVFPPQCIGCNGNDGLRMKPYMLSWVHPAFYLILVIGLIPGAILLTLTQRKCKVKMATCRHCRHHILIRQLITAGIITTAFGAFFLGAVFHRYFALAGLGILLTGIIYGIVATRLYSIVSIKDDVVTLSGLGEAFVASLDQR